jgi:outer membrane scaffolding protein for murein synthesis (MipA/OmpV family)
MLLAASGARAQSDSAFLVPFGEDTGFVGLGLANGPRYLGSDERRTRIAPMLDYRWKNGWFAGTTYGAGYNFSSERRMQYGVRLSLAPGRDEDDAAALAGMGDIKTRPELGLFFNWLVEGNLYLRSALRYGSGNDRRGLALDLAAGYFFRLGPQWRATTGLSSTYLNGNAMRSYFGVDADQSARSGYPVYQPSDGLRDIRLHGSLFYIIDPRWSLIGTLAATRLVGDAADSPIVRDKTSFTGLFGVRYWF